MIQIFEGIRDCEVKEEDNSENNKAFTFEAKYQTKHD